MLARVESRPCLHRVSPRRLLPTPAAGTRPGQHSIQTPLWAPVGLGSHLQQATRYPNASTAPRISSAMGIIAEGVVQLQGTAEEVRLDQQLLDMFPDIFTTMTAAKRACRRKEVLVNGKRCSTATLVNHGHIVQLLTRMATGQQWVVAADKPTLPLAYEDDYMAVVIKPQGLPTQGKGEGCVQGRVKYCLQPTLLPGALHRPHQVHRLDAPTGGLLLVAKTRPALSALGGQLARHQMTKRYDALVIGRLEGCGLLEYPVDGKPSVSLFRVCSHHPSRSFGTLTWVSLWPKTGRQHQLRKHMAYFGHPILGDMKYKHQRRPNLVFQQLQDVADYLPGPSQQTPAPAAGAEPDQTVNQAAAAATVAGLPCGSHQQAPVPAEAAVTTASCCAAAGAAAAAAVPATQPPAAASAASAGHQAVAAGAAAEPIMSVAQAATAGCGAAGGKETGGHAPGAPSAAGEVIVHPDTASSLGCSSYHDLAARQPTSEVDSEDDGEGDAHSTSSEGGSSSSGRKVEVLQDGRPVPLCLWAVQLLLQHPVSGQQLHVAIDHVVTDLYAGLLGRDAPS